MKDLLHQHITMPEQGRVHNFGAGPAVLPLSVVEEVRDALPNLNGSGFGLLELSHRSDTFQAVVDSAMSRIRETLSIPDDYTVLLLQGGASLQFYMSALNLLPSDGSADYLVTGGWSQKALKEAQRVGDAQAIWDAADSGFKSVPTDGDYSVRDSSTYLHYTSNNTLYGTQFHHLPDSGGKMRVLDASSDIVGVPLDVSAHDLIYAGAQKNLGPSGVTLSIMSPEVLERIPDGIPTMLDYGVHASKGSLFNTPNTFGIYVLDRVFAWLGDNGGMQGAINRNSRKAELLYRQLDSSPFWQPHAEQSSRSVMNVTWRLADKDLEPQFLEQAATSGLGGLKGHRSVGGIRASLYNGCSIESVEALVGFMEAFESSNC